MCGRAVQTYYAAQAAANDFHIPLNATATARSNSGYHQITSHPTRSSISNQNVDTSRVETSAEHDDSDDLDKRSQDNFNMSPGMAAIVFWQDHDRGQICSGRKVWGLLPRNGTADAPLSLDLGQHFTLNMFNARADTLYQKTTFARLARAGQTCIVAVDGYFEWKTQGKGNKQPYFVTRNTDDSKPYLLMAGLWTSVRTGYDDNNQLPSTLHTFTMITTDACPSLRWLHHRMPVCIWDEELARQWLARPSPALHEQIERAARTTRDGWLRWHAVTTAMSSLKFRSKEAIQPLPKLKTVSSFFAPKTEDSNDDGNKNDTIKSESSNDNGSSQKESTVSKRKLSTTNNASSATSTASPPTKQTKISNFTTLENNSATNKIDTKKPKPKGTLDAFFKPR